ncbi:MAG TPA: CoB--CoM heterodisulfide reductase iron-sulfur subunit B family protein [Anaerolineae bacterium]|nr:CoB--CoM heterodisulfide reductase iron-sulfur subunit B family protein [Anaerolineae bacterium]
MRYALFLGCTAPVRALNYEKAARGVASRLGIELHDINDFGCCGFPVKSVNREAALLMAARNLALAEEQGIDVCALCSSCTGTLAEANRTLCADPALLERINVLLRKTSGLEYQGHVRIRHFVRLLYEEIGPGRLRRSVRVDLSGLRLAAHYGCHYLKPGEAHDHFDDPENPTSLDQLIEATGAQSIPYEGRELCCGGGILAADEHTALELPRLKLARVAESGADALVIVCPFCDIMYELQQRRIEKLFDTRFNLPVLFYPQLLGVALGLSADEVGLPLNRVKSRTLMGLPSGGEA